MKVKELIDCLYAYNPDAKVIMATSPLDNLEVLSVYTNDKEDIVYIDLEEMELDYMSQTE